jgi:dipeptide/tripeptide permease
MQYAASLMAKESGDVALKPGLWTQLRGFNRVFWIGNSMEMIERLAYYGLRAVVALYIVEALENGGPQFTQVEKGVIFAWWAAVQSFVPIFTGGFADKYGYKLTVAISVAIKIAGYLVMAYALELGSATSGGTSVGVPGHGHVYAWFMAGACLLALGTAVFKPGIQPIISLNLKKEDASVGWALFYQVVNIGGFLGPYLAGAMRLMAWRNVFIACAVIVAINWLILLTFPEPEKEDDGNPGGGTGGFLGSLKVLWDSFIGICEPRLIAFLVIFSGFWAMFHQLFDLLPNYIDDWVDSTMIADQVAAPLFGIFGAELPEAWNGLVPPEQMINLNAGMCMTLAFLIGFFTGKMRSMTAMIAGIVVSAAAIYALGLSVNGWWTLGCIASFSIGELMSSPTKLRYFSSIAPPGKQGLYLGYVNATGGIGWALGALIAGEIYEESGDKVVLARRHLVDVLGQDPNAVSEQALAKTEVMPRLAELTDQTVFEAQRMLFETYDPTGVWTHFAIIGVVSMLGLIAFDFVTRYKVKGEPYILLAMMSAIAFYTYGLMWALVFAGMMVAYLGLEKVRPSWLPQGRGDD